jgi:hypothetical protein
MLREPARATTLMTALARAPENDSAPPLERLVFFAVEPEKDSCPARRKPVLLVAFPVMANEPPRSNEVFFCRPPENPKAPATDTKNIADDGERNLSRRKASRE